MSGRHEALASGDGRIPRDEPHRGAELEKELADTRLLLGLGSELIGEDDSQALYEKIMEAAVAIMRSDFASMQMLHPERGTGGELRLLAFRGFNPEAARFWESVRTDSCCTCGMALKRKTRVVEEDVSGSASMAGTADQATYLQTGIRAVQSTPLVARNGKLVGMISTHWRQPHRPAERELRLLDILAKHAAALLERKKAEEAARTLAAIVETSDDAIISKDLNSIITSWNRGAEILYGYTAQEAVGRPVTMLIPPDRLNEEPGILQRMREGRRIEHYETVRRRKDGTLVDISLSVSPIIDGEGKIIGASKIARDITDRKRTEAILREADRNKDEFLAMLSHELRNPLAPMRHCVTLLQQADEDEIRRQASSILDRQVEHMTRLIEDLLDVSRISRGDIDVRKQEIDLAQVVQSAVEAIRPVVEAAGHRLEIELPRSPVSVVADRQRIAQVVSNLLSNAAKYTPQGGRIDVELSKLNGSAVISVRDNGIGIAAGDLPRLFNMYTQLDGGRRRAPGGLGVGLAIARQLVALHGGTIEARSAGTGQGSEFTVRIPTSGLPHEARDAGNTLR